MPIAHVIPAYVKAALPEGDRVDLAGARRLKLVTRFDRPEPGYLTAGMYVQWRQPRFHKGK